MGLYERVLGLEEFKIPVHAFSALMAEFARSRITGAQAQAGVELTSGAPLTPAEVVEAQALLATITGSATARLARAKEIDDVITLAEARVTQYDTAAEIKARLGV
jgi:Asp-tRNA(Asn)/Glu-tRNA(Gln) amidotransferase B subunit